MVKLADTTDLKSVALSGMWVRIPPHRQGDMVKLVDTAHSKCVELGSCRFKSYYPHTCGFGVKVATAVLETVERKFVKVQILQSALCLVMVGVQSSCYFLTLMGGLGFAILSN